MPSLRVGTWNIAGARREQTNQVDLDAVVAGVRALGVDLLAVQEVDRMLARSGRADQPAVIAQALDTDWFWSYAPALVGDDFRPLSGPDPGGPATATCWCRGCPWSGWSTCGSPRPAAANSAPRCWPPSRWRPARHGGGHPPVQQAGPQRPPAPGAGGAGRVPGGRRGCWWAT